jgi:DNA polymerase elongation subunit (family B)
MQVPLTISTYFDNSGGQQKLKMWSNGKRNIVTAPIRPYAYSKTRPMLPCIMTSVTRRLLSNPFKEVNLYKCEFNSSGDVGRYCTNDDIYMENHIQFQNRSMIDKPEWVKNFANTDELKIMSFDCEMMTDGRTFPMPARNSICGIGYKCTTGIKNTGLGGIDNDEIITIWSEKKGQDAEIIDKFLHEVEKFDPDILVGFNSNGFDLRYIRDRCAINGINFNRYIARSMDTRDPVEFVEKKNLASRKKYVEVRIDGRISYDLYYPVIRDQSMFGIKNRTMKTVAEWYKIKDIIKEDMSNVNRYLETEDGRKQINKYLRSDVNITDQLFKIYSANTLMLAEKLIIPLDEVVNATSSLLSNLIFGRELMSKNIVSDGQVGSRYEKKHVINKRGGWVETYRPGFIKKLKKLDFKSYYPFLTVQFNISSETCFIVRYEDYTDELADYKFYWKEEEYKGIGKIRWFYAHIPDSTLGKTVVIRINMSEEGFLPRYMRELFDERAMLKNRMKDIEKEIGKDNTRESVEYAGLKSRENAIKIIINSFTGYVGNEHALYGNLACYVAITGMGRYFTQKIINRYKDLVVSSDTDAIYEDISTGGISEADANKYIESIVVGELGFDKCWIVMEEEGNFGSAFFMKTIGKNYYIHDLDKDIVIKHGVATKRSSLARFVDVSADEIVIALLKGGMSCKNDALVEAVDKAYDMSKWTIRDIQQGVHVRKASDYKKGTPIGLTIGQLAKQKWKIPEANLDGMQVSYIKLRGNGRYAVVSDTDNIKNFDYDKEYYVGMLDKLLENLGLKDFHPSNKGTVRTVQRRIEEAWG